MTKLLAPLLGGCLLLAGMHARSENLPPTAVDHRIAITVTAEERNQVLYEMRDLLHHLFNIFTALSRNDMGAVAKSAEPLGGSILERMPKGAREKAPVAFLEMSHGMHEIFRVMARDAEAKRDMSHSLEQMAEALTYCSGCHDTYRLQSKPFGR